MLTIFMYPVSGIMKLWHFITHSFLDDQTAWLVSIVLLVLTIRGLIAPLSWSSVKMGRTGALMRPAKRDIERRTEEATTIEEYKALQVETEELNKKFNYRPLIGCIPPLIMMPFFLGLYQVVLRMARPSTGDTVGLLSAAEVEAFRETTFMGIPLPAFVSMPHDWAAELGITGEEVRHVIMPWLVAALIFTTVNMVITGYRAFLTTQFDQKVPRRMFYFVVIIIPFVPFMLWHLAMTGPIPVAIILYWACTNLFTLCQTLVFEVFLRRRMPLGTDVHELRRQSWKDFRANRKNKLSRAEKKEEKGKKQARRKMQQQASRELMAERRAARKEVGRQQGASAANAGETVEGEAAEASPAPEEDIEKGPREGA
ncbi:membrane protein insertase YidC [Corynebacterium confusum]|uniref:membrane protein insertase YidC n=1 Tax=Corynebacterium confusum TaxID=71254 RepID=UPI0025B30111|nr:membrane protein insertase YidC [Corynebacterium confusum]WJY90689.1 Membrane protein insertase MisCA precursor [Corynebacterium confusum]